MKVLLFWLAILTPAVADADYWEFECSKEEFSSGSSFERNLKNAASSLPAEVSSSAPFFFANYSIGSEQTGKIYALASCREDTNGSVCQSCVAKALYDASAACPLKKGAVMLYNTCSTAFSDMPFDVFPMMNTSANVAFLEYNKSAGAAIHGDVIRSLIGPLFDRAAESSPMHFVTARKEIKTDGHTVTVYGHAQCVHSMSASDCHECLEFLASFAQEDASSEASTVGTRTSNIWSEYRWEEYAFFSGSPLLDLGAERTNDHHHKKKKRWVIFVAVVVPGIVIIQLCGVLDQKEVTCVSFTQKVSTKIHSKIKSWPKPVSAAHTRKAQIQKSWLLAGTSVKF